VTAADPANRAILRSVSQRPFATVGGRLFKASPEGREALFTAFMVEHWLQTSPQGPLDFEGDDAAAAVAALVDGWSASIVHMLARGPMSLAQLDRAIVDVGRRELKRLLAALLRTGQVETLAGDGETLYAATDWMRRGIAPVISAARLERRSPSEGMTPIDALDVEAGFRCALAVIELPKQLTGVCRLRLNLEHGGRTHFTGVTADVDRGQIVSCDLDIGRRADAWALGSVEDWLDTVIEPDVDRVHTGNDRWLTEALLSELHDTLFGVRVL